MKNKAPKDLKRHLMRRLRTKGAVRFSRFLLGIPKTPWKFSRIKGQLIGDELFISELVSPSRKNLVLTYTLETSLVVIKANTQEQPRLNVHFWALVNDCDTRKVKHRVPLYSV